MNGVDYSKALARERDNYQTSMQKDREYNAKRLAEEKERHEVAQQKQLKSYQEDRAEIEVGHKKTLEDIKAKTSESISDMKDRFQRQSQGEQHRFHSEREASRKDYDERMRDIRNSYQNAFKGEERGNRAIQETQGKRYNDNVDRLVKERDRDLEGFQERFAQKGVDLQDQYKDEKKQLVRAHEQHLESVYKDESAKRTALKDSLQKDLTRTKSAHANNEEQMQTYTRDKIRNVTENYTKRAEDMAEDYSLRNENLVEKQKEESLQTNRKHKNEITDLRTGYERGIRNSEIEKRRRDGNSEEFGDIIRRQQGVKDEFVQNEKIQQLKREKTQMRQDFDKSMASTRDKDYDTLKTEMMESKARHERLERESMADQITAVSNVKEDAQKKQELQEQSQFNERNRYENQISTERGASRENIQKLRENFHKSLTDLQDRNDKLMEQVKKQSNDDKAKFITNNSIQTNEQVTDLRRSFSKLMDTTVQDYEARLNSAARENAQLKDELNQKVGFLMADAEARLHQQTRDYEDKSAADKKESQLEMARRQDEFQTQTRNLSNNYQKRIDELTYDAEMKMKHTINTYEAKIRQQNADYTKALTEKDTIVKEQIKRLKASLELERAQLITQYENQINQLKMANETDGEKLKDYKEIS